MGEYADKIKGKANEAMGDAKQDSDNPATRAEGRDQEAKGEGQQAKGKVKGVINKL